MPERKRFFIDVFPYKDRPTKKFLLSKPHILHSNGVLYNLCWSEGPKKHPNLNSLSPGTSRGAAQTLIAGARRHLPQGAAPYDL